MWCEIWTAYQFFEKTLCERQTDSEACWCLSCLYMNGVYLTGSGVSCDHSQMSLKLCIRLISILSFRSPTCWPMVLVIASSNAQSAAKPLNTNTIWRNTCEFIVVSLEFLSLPIQSYISNGEKRFYKYVPGVGFHLRNDWKFRSRELSIPCRASVH